MNMNNTNKIKIKKKRKKGLKPLIKKIKIFNNRFNNQKIRRII